MRVKECARNAINARWNRDNNYDSELIVRDEDNNYDGQLIVCDGDFGTAVEQMVTSAISSPVWDTLSEM